MAANIFNFLRFGGVAAIGFLFWLTFNTAITVQKNACAESVKAWFFSTTLCVNATASFLIVIWFCTQKVFETKTEVYAWLLWNIFFLTIVILTGFFVLLGVTPAQCGMYYDALYLGIGLAGCLIFVIITLILQIFCWDLSPSSEHEKQLEV